MSFQVIPALDLRGGRVVRLVQGDYARETQFADDPVAMAVDFANRGVRRLHLVDLDGARSGRPDQFDVVATIAAIPGLVVQAGGGIRTMADVEAYLSAGVRWVILGTVALRDPQLVRTAATRFPGKIIVGLDARGGRVAVSGWLEQSEVGVVDVARAFSAAGVAAVIYTDIARDGMGTGADVLGSVRLARESGMPVIASGGVGSLADLEALAAHSADGLAGVVVGRAILSGDIPLEAAIAVGKADSEQGAMPLIP